MRVSNAEFLNKYSACTSASVKQKIDQTMGLKSSFKPNTKMKTINMNSISLNEINELIKAGVNGFLDIVPEFSSQLINPYGSEYAADVKVDLIGQIKASIEFKKSIGESVDYLNNVLTYIRDLDGATVPIKVNTVV